MVLVFVLVFGCAASFVFLSAARLSKPAPLPTRTRSGTLTCVLSQTKCSLVSGVSLFLSEVTAVLTAVHVMKYVIRPTWPRNVGGRPGGSRMPIVNEMPSPGLTIAFSPTESPTDPRATYRSPGDKPDVFVGSFECTFTHAGSKRSMPCHANSMERTNTGEVEVRARTRTVKSWPGVTASTSRSVHSNTRGETFAEIKVIAHLWRRPADRAWTRFDQGLPLPKRACLPKRPRY